MIADLPSLTVFDEFVVKACGFYCQASCKRGRGFPSVILSNWRSCLRPNINIKIPPPPFTEGPELSIDRSSFPTDVNSTQFVRVRKQTNFK